MIILFMFEYVAGTPRFGLRLNIHIYVLNILYYLYCFCLFLFSNIDSLIKTEILSKLKLNLDNSTYIYNLLVYEIFVLYSESVVKYML